MMAPQSDESIVALFFWRRSEISLAPSHTMIESSAKPKTT